MKLLLLMLMSILLPRRPLHPFSQDLDDDGLGQVRSISGGDNTSRVNLQMRLIIMFLDMLHVHRLRHLGHLINPPSPLQDVGVILLNSLDVTLEMSMVNWVESHNGRPETEIGFGQSVSNKVVGLGKDVLDTIEGFEERIDVVLVGGLGGCEAGLVDAVVDGVIDPFVDGVDLSLEVGRVVVDTGLGGDQFVECSVQHSDDLTALVVDYHHACTIKMSMG